MKKYKIVLIHILVWVLYVALNALDYIPRNISPDQNVQFLIIKQYTFYSIFILLFYINSYLLYPRYFSTKKFAKYNIGLFCLWVFSYFVYLLHGYFLFIISGNYEYFSIRLPFYLGVVFYFIYFTGLSIGWSLLHDWFKNQSLQDELSQAKLALLNFQISPHFLFNTLNNIYLLVKRKEDKAPEAILMLSDLLRSTLIEDIDEKVSIANELSYLNNFIELQKLRLEHPEIINYEKVGDANGHFIYPLLLIPFIENAFKHGDFNSVNTVINIRIELLEGSLKLKVENSYKEKLKDSTRGIGIKNVINRLEYFYKSEYKLNVTDSNNIYLVELEIKL
jgi:two-component system, LytTR family, sensor kinase